MTGPEAEMVSALPPAMVRSPEIFVATPMSRPVDGAAVPMPTRPDDSCTTNCVPPIVKPCPLAIEVVPLVVVNCPRPKYPVPDAVMLVVLAPPAAVKRPEAMVEEACELNPFTSVRKPVESKVEVAEPPKYALSKTERRVVEAWVNVERPVSESVPAESVPMFAVLAFAVVEVAVAKYPIPLEVMFVVDAPPAAVKRPEAMVEDACETNPVLKVASPLTLRVETSESVPAERTPMLPFVLYRFVDDAVVLNKFVVVA